MDHLVIDQEDVMGQPVVSTDPMDEHIGELDDLEFKKMSKDKELKLKM